jgi:hypothetical protein
MKYTIIRPDPTLQNNLMSFGFECDPGWHSMIYELLDKIQRIVDDNGYDIEVVEIKEKYGGLRVYLSSSTDEIDGLIREYEDRSYITCEVCGKPGSMRDRGGWYKTLCDACYQGWIEA